MAYDEALADRIRRALGPEVSVREIKMFGGLCFMVRGHMSCGVIGDEMMLRVGKDGEAAALARKHARQMDFTGRPMPGMIYVAREGCSTRRAVDKWVELGLAFNATLGPKVKARNRRPPRFPGR
jgi:TfoX/Sxy family transcriptional regulator of competence genes